LKGLEQPALAVQRNADAGVADGKMQEPLFGMPKKISVVGVAGLNRARPAACRSHLDDNPPWLVNLIYFR
jgi:hypothetical protein